MSEVAVSAFSRHITFMALGDDPELLDEDFVRLLAELVTERGFEADEVLQKKGEVVTVLLLVTEGAVCQADGRPLAADPVMHGLDGALLDGSFTRTLVAKTKGRALTVRKDAFFELLEDQFPTSTMMLHVMGVRLFAAAAQRTREGPAIDVGTSLVDRALALRACGALARVSPETIACLARLSTVKEIEPGDSLALSPAALHLLVKGELMVTREGCETEAQRHLGLTLVNTAATFAGLFGFEARAVRASTLLVLDKDDLITEMRYHFGLWLALAGAMVREGAVLDGSAR